MSWLINDFFETRKLRNTQPAESDLSLCHKDVLLLCFSETKSPDEILMAKEDELLDPGKIWDRKWDKFIAGKISG